MSKQTELTDAEMLRYARQILLEGWDIEAQTRLKNSCAIIIGMGGLGCPLAETLCRAGIGKLLIIDDDTIDESNLQRQSLFTPHDIGQSKALVAKAKLNQINAFCDVIAIQARLTADNYQQMVEQAKINSLSKFTNHCHSFFFKSFLLPTQGNRTTKPLKSKNRLNCEQKGEPSCSPIRLTI